jgi:glycosyltransferase involved in cell wall biosynthesis
LTDALRRHQARILFVLPRAVDSPGLEGSDDEAEPTVGSQETSRNPRGDLTLAPVVSEIDNPYFTTTRRSADKSDVNRELAENPEKASPKQKINSSVRVLGVGSGDGYDGDLSGKIRAFADRCVGLTRRELFDVVHAHEWMTFPAAVRIAEFSGRPLVAHVHATEFDRSGERLNGPIFEIERYGMHAAARVVAVSHRTRQTIIERYGVPPDKVFVVHNGIDFDRAEECPRRVPAREKVVLFLGRITMQKGPEFFVRAAARVAERMDNVRFVMAGAGDLVPDMAKLVGKLGLEGKVEFTGFLRGDEVRRAYEGSDVYVMPSVSEPFGLTALEAVRHGVPVILSKSSGAAEVLERGSLKVDFWDTEMMARQIVSVLRYPRLRETLMRAAADEIQGLTWDKAALKCTRFYNELTVDRVETFDRGPAAPMQLVAERQELCAAT